MSGLSVATIKSPEFINITSINPLISKCEIKVLYVGANRNMSYITKEVATEMAKTLPGTPIVGYYSENKEDFGDHGDQMIIDSDGIRFNCLTKPYGFVDINAKPWFQEFEDTDEFGNKTLREYLMCEGYLWTEQYEEAKKVINEGRPQSMELDEKTLKGHWSTDSNRGIEFFIINDAIFSKLCILGEDVEPCFEGSSVTAPEVSSSFTFKSDEFTSTLFTMMKELKELTFSLQNKGGSSMDNLKDTPENSFVVAENAGDPAPSVSVEAAPAPEAEVETPIVEEAIVEEISVEEDKDNQEGISENQNNIEELDETSEEESNESEEDTELEEEDEEDEEEGEDKYTILEQKFNELTEKYSSLEEENKKLLAFKTEVEDKEKDALIASFYMLSEEDKKDVISNKSNYTLEDIEKELSVICVRKKVSFDNNNDSEKNESGKSALIYNLNDTESSNDDLPPWLKAVEARRNAE